MKKALICGGHGFIGHHLALKLWNSGYWVRTVDINDYVYGDLTVDDYVIGDLRDPEVCDRVTRGPDGKPFFEIFQLGAWMGGAGVIFTGDHDAQVIHDSGLINLNMAEACKNNRARNIFYSSSACVYDHLLQLETNNCGLKEDMAYPAYPDSCYGWEKLVSEQMWQSYARNYGMNVHIARFHNIFGIEGAWDNGKEKSPSAICRKVARAKDGDTIDIWGDGDQTRSFLYIDECLEGVRRLMNSDFQGPVNIGSDEMISINGLVEMVKDIAGKPNITINHIPGPLGVRGRTSDNTLIKQKLGWAPSRPLREGIEKLYAWIDERVKKGEKDIK
jgi:GDP-D-mannose 3', 5'-epimerase